MISVDVIILSWDRMDDTIAAIDSAVAQKGVDLNVYVVDQGSKPDGLKTLLDHCAGLERVHVRCNDENAGVPGGRNQASAMGRGDYIVALDNDAVFTDDNVCARAAAMMEADAELGGLAFRISVFDSPINDPVVDKSSWAYAPLDAEAWAGRTFPVIAFVGAGHIIRRKAFEAVGAYDERLFFMHEETDFCDRLINAGYRIEYRPECAVRHKVSAEHRVQWKAGRYQLHLRNWAYIQMKQEGVSFNMLAELIVRFVGGVRAGFMSGSVKGLLGVMKMAPAALRERKSNPYVRRSQEGAKFIDEIRRATGQSAVEPKPWDNAPGVWQLICRLRWETDFREQYR